MDFTGEENDILKNISNIMGEITLNNRGALMISFPILLVCRIFFRVLAF